MSDNFRASVPSNEPVHSYAPGTPERASLKSALARVASEQAEIPLVIGGRHVRTGNTANVVMPHRHGHVLATWHKAGRTDVEDAIRAALAARREWSSWKLEDRAAIFLRAADLLSTTWRDVLNSATMLNQSKTVHQAEIDSACEMIDFLRFNAY